MLPPSRDEWVTPATPQCVGGSSGASNVLPHAGLESISPHSHVPTQALPLDAPSSSHLQLCFLYCRSALQYLLVGQTLPSHLVGSSAVRGPPSPLSHPCPPSSLLSASSQLCRMSGTGSALVGRAMRTAACPPSMRCCRPRSCPSRYLGDPLPPGDPPHQRGV